MTFVLLLLSVWLLLKPLLHFPNFPVGYYLRPHTQRQTGTPTWPRQHAGHTQTDTHTGIVFLFAMLVGFEYVALVFWPFCSHFLRIA